jgi:hypothetical protein
MPLLVPGFGEGVRATPPPGASYPKRTRAVT